MIYCVDIREKQTRNTIEIVLETKSHDRAWEVVNQYNKEYGEYKYLLEEYPKDKYFIDVFENEME